MIQEEHTELGKSIEGSGECSCKLVLVELEVGEIRESSYRHWDISSESVFIQNKAPKIEQGKKCTYVGRDKTRSEGISENGLQEISRLSNASGQEACTHESKSFPVVYLT